MRARAYAKVNLGLEVAFRREDGYHELRTIFQTIDLCDLLYFQPAEKGIELVTDDADIPAGSDNLVVRAARALSQAMGTAPGVRIVLEKHIPPGRGLGGGSSDAATALLALNQLWDAHFSVVELARLGRGIGMDVPFFLVGGTALGIGRGEEVYPLELEIDKAIVLILPEFAMSTVAAYRRLMLTKREATFKLQCLALSNIGGGEELLGLANDLESAAGDYSPAIHKYKTELLDLGALVSLMSGSGSAVFGIFEDDRAARSAAQSLTSSGTHAIATRTLTRRAYRERRLDTGPSSPSEP